MSIEKKPDSEMSDVSASALSEIIEMAWCDKTSFDDIYAITGFSEPDVIKIMRGNMKPSSFRMWRKRVAGRPAKHEKKKGQAET